MTKTLYWLQGGGCGGDTLSVLNAETPAFPELLEMLDIRLLWHPSLSNLTPHDHDELLSRIETGEQEVDIFCMEGAVLRGPAGTGMYDTFRGRPRKDLVFQLASRARYVVAVGTCASFGGMSAIEEIEGMGLQFLRQRPGGFLGGLFKSRSGLPVINLPGCPVHCDVLLGTLTAIAREKPLDLTDYNMPGAWYDLLVHQGCTRNEYHEYRVEEQDFGEKGCLFFHRGCHGPIVPGPCNKVLWNRRSSKTRVGVPCFGCTRPDFPQDYPFFETLNIEGIPKTLPDGVDRAHYLAYKSMAAAAAPQRLIGRKTKV